MRVLVVALVCFSFFNVLKAQDSIFRYNGDVIVGTRLEIDSEEIRYRKLSDPEGVVYVLPTSTLSFVILHNREVVEFGLKSNASSVRFDDRYTQYNKPTLTGMNSESWFQKGQEDAKLYHLKHKTAGTMALVSVLFMTPLFGLAPPLAMSIFEPNMNTLNVPYPTYQSNPEYMLGYKIQAGKMKRKAIWKNYAIGSSIYISFILVMIGYGAIIFL